MSVQYWLDSFFIDLSRNQITLNEQSQTLAPKALAVLTCLAENQRNVVSQDELLAKVWQDTTVSPNTLQKSIAQLRKALGDDGSTYIKTHAKKGYSLECDVRWHDVDSEAKTEIGATTNLGSLNNSDITSNQTVTDKRRASARLIGLFSIFSVLIVFGIFGFTTFSHQQTPTLSFSKFRALTSTDNGEYASIYSPDGEYMVFHRYSAEDCINNIWAKNTRTQKETQLTKNFDAYGRHSFSKDGKQLVFIKTVNCDEPVNQKKCYQLVSLDFQKALKEPQPMKVLLECKNSEIKAPHWLNNNNIALLQKQSDRWRLISYSISENKSEIIHSLNDGNVIDYDYSVEKDEIALTSVHSDGNYYIEMLKPDGTLISSHPIKYPPEIASYRFIYPNFSSIDNQLIFSTGRQLFTLSTEGEISDISLPVDQPMGTPVFHPNGQQMLVIKGYFDSDIASFRLPLSPQSQSTQSQNRKNELNKGHTILERSILAEDDAMFQPQGELLAFKSERSGDEQVWIADEQGARQLTHFPMDTNLYGMDWAGDGKSLLVNVYHELKQVFLDGRVVNIDLGYPVDTLFQWDSSNHTTLANIRIKGVLRFAEIDLINSKARIISDRPAKWALKSKNGRLVYTDKMDRFWLSGGIEDQLIEVLKDQGSDLRFITKDDVIYGVNENFQLWSYQLDPGRFTILGSLPRNIDYIADISDKQLLASLRVSSRKEVAELYLSE
ncbi:winged helix-turn-helix domain-containing protein [Aliikangiella sp. G2MR2-5]|uniref:winged helix-turn-helix domain-containing protein n=1 Tax=Aliikangiella sp. G2MR2-5 TaxID=2788943 RepID=UPI0018A8AA05|nr:winged helix-turn-helix domain-containing protein [Aliikangiella sp. G2MR2-5]